MYRLLLEPAAQPSRKALKTAASLIFMPTHGHE